MTSRTGLLFKTILIGYNDGPIIGNGFLIKKCYHLTIGKNLNSRKTFYLCGKKLEVVNSNPYLGIEFKHDLKWDNYINNIKILTELYR